MPTIKQLPAATAVAGTDLIPLSQNGLTRGVAISTLLSNTQPLLSLAQSTLLGRVSAGLGGPEAIGIGSGLTLQNGALSATAFDHLGLAVSANLLPDDEIVVNSLATPKRLAAVKLRSLFTAGSGVQIDNNGVISATSTVSGGGGSVGAAGPKGDNGAQGPAGQGFTFRGPWQQSISYSPYDVVTNGGQTYVATVAIAAAAIFSAASWALVAAQGATGPSGATGPAGPTIIATSTTLGAIKPGTGLAVAADGTLSIGNIVLGSIAQGGATVGQLLGWSGTSWLPTTPAAGVSYTGAAPVTVASGVISLGQSNATTGQVLTWTGSSWSPTTPVASVNYIGAAPVTVASGVIGLGQNNATAGQVLAWSGSSWSPTTPTPGVNYTGASPVTVASGVISLGQSNATTGQVLTWTGSVWQPQNAPATGAMVGSATPLSDGTATSGIAATASREDHRHPTDTSRAPLAGPVFATSITLPSWTTTTRPSVPTAGMEGYATDTSRRETYTAAGWVQYVRTTDIPAASGQLLGGSGTAGATIAVSVGSGLTLSNGVLTAASTTAPAIAAVTGVSIDGSSIPATSASPYQMATADRVVDVNKSSGAATKILLPQNPTLWVDYTIIDGRGDATINNITLSLASGATINGQPSFTMNANNDAISLRAVNATTWRIS